MKNSIPYASYYDFGVVPDEVIWECIQNKIPKIIAPPQVIDIDRRRLRVYFLKGKTCAACGRTGTVFRSQAPINEKNLQEWYWRPYEVEKVYTHINLYGTDHNGVVFMMTVDHIWPRSKGGTWALDNLQPMCERCNRKKADKIES